MDEVFGHDPNRPEHPDLWRLVEIILRTDGAAEAGEKIVRTRLARAADLGSLRYLALQRAKRVRQIAADHGWPPVRALNTAWLDGFLAGHALGVQDRPDVATDPTPGEDPEERP
jgi:hypothetical protein